ncbi:MAG: hypothetical protein SGJ20_16365 [Planctomycetota bacterium]|nr:hypothetical protein [Planctomycetota bacterium]
MGKFLSRFVFALALSVFSGPVVVAAPMLSLASPQAGSPVNIGDTLSIRVELSGLESPAQLDMLAAAVHFPNSHVSVSEASIVKGNLLPVNLDDPLDFQASTSSIGGGISQVDAFYGTFSDTHLLTAETAKTFIEFEATVLAEGDFTFSFGSFDATRYQFSPGDPIEVGLVAGPGLSFNAVPEPAAWVLCAVGVVLALFAHCRLSLRRKSAACHHRHSRACGNPV